MSLRKPDTKGRRLYTSIYRKCPEKAHPRRQKVNEQPPGAGGKGNGGTA